jgi:hypothetical protein
MRLDHLYSSNGVESIKRRWLEQLLTLFPEHDFTYIPMLTDKDEHDRKSVIEDFRQYFKNHVVTVYNEAKKYDGNVKDSYFGNEAHAYKNRGSKDEIIFIDADIGFYQLDVDGTPNNKKKFKHYVMMHYIDLLMNPFFNFSEDSLIVVYQSISEQVTMKQYNPSGRKQIENVEYELKNYTTGKNYLWYEYPNYTATKLKFYFFSKKDWSDKLG